MRRVIASNFYKLLTIQNERKRAARAILVATSRKGSVRAQYPGEKMTSTSVLSILAMAAIIAAGSANFCVGGPVPAENEPLQKEAWPDARVLVWAEPGTSGGLGGPWTEYASTKDYLAKKEGRSTKRGPDEDTDVILPDAPEGEPYVVSYDVVAYRRKGGLNAPQSSFRHITIGNGAGLDAGYRTSRGNVSYNRGETTVAIYGNVIVKDGGYIFGPRVFLGDKHTFFRMGESPMPLDKSWIVRKTGDASVTLLGQKIELSEWIRVESGRLVVQNSELRFGAGYATRIEDERQHSPEDAALILVKTGAALEIGAGARVGRNMTPESVVPDLSIEGLLQIGLPSVALAKEGRPDRKSNDPAVIELSMAEGSGGFLEQYGGLYIGRAAEVKNYGKLEIRTSNIEHPTSNIEGGDTATTNRGICIFLENTVDLGDVTLDYLRSGGIAATDLKVAQSAVAKATFGKHCAVKGADLFSTFQLMDFKGGVGSVEFVDGLKTDCRILFPHAGRLIVRGKGYRTLQSFDLNSIHAVTIDGKRTEFNAKRALSEKEQELRSKNALWGDEVGEGQYGKYATQEWPDCPVMIWARPGVSGRRFVGPNWLDETGRPHFDVPLMPQRNTRSDNAPVDVLIPASDTPYSVSGWGKGGNEGTPPHRHLTVEYNATYGLTYNVQGNFWMKHGGALVGKHRGRFHTRQPDLHRFMRYDGERLNHEGESQDSRDATIAQWGDYGTGEGGTLELVGTVRAATDRLYIMGPGTLIISEGAELSDGGRAAISLASESTLALLEDAKLGYETSMQISGCASIWADGTITVGLPDRPIRRDTVLAVAGMTTNQVDRNVGGHGRAPGASLIMKERSSFRVYSADPEKARVIIKMHDSEFAKERGKKYEDRAGAAEGIVCVFAGETDLNGVVFDNILEGGIVVSPEKRENWKNIFYGTNNAAKPEDLYWDPASSGTSSAEAGN
jgi:hypothetical protein